MIWHILCVLAFVVIYNIYRYYREEYLRLMLDSFFRTARTIAVEIEKCKLQECEK